MTLPRHSPGGGADERWWLPADIDVGDSFRVRVGPLSLQARRTAHEWQLAFERKDESELPGGTEWNPDSHEPAPENLQRFMFTRTDARLSLLPVLADRPIVIRPRQAVFLPGGEEVTLYISSPVTIRVRVGEPGMRLCDLPTVCLSDTWFGASTREGELCYSGRTHARQDLDEIPRRAHRVITAARIRNAADSPLPLDRLSLPVPVLSVYASERAGLWTESVSLVRSGDSGLATLHVDESAPAYAGEAVLISGAHRKADHGGLVRAFSALFRDVP